MNALQRKFFLDEKRIVGYYEEAIDELYIMMWWKHKDANANDSSVMKEERVMMPKNRKSVIWHWVSTVLLIALAITAGYFYRQYQKALHRSPELNELGQVIDQVSKLMELPTGETPTLATVTDQSKLSGQNFFAHSEDGDKVLLYSDSKLAILFRPSTKKIINVAPISAQEAEAAARNDENKQSAEPAQQETLPESLDKKPDAVVSEQPSQPSSVSQPTKIVLLNGTEKAGMTFDFERDYLQGNSDVEILAKESAARKDYQQTIVVDVTKKNTPLAESLAGEANTSVEALPEGETVPEGADIIVIIGQDRI